MAHDLAKVGRRVALAEEKDLGGSCVNCSSCRLAKFYCQATMKCASKDLQAATRFMRNSETKRLNKGKIERLCAFSVATPPWAIRIERALCFMQMRSPEH